MTAEIQRLAAETALEKAPPRLNRAVFAEEMARLGVAFDKATSKPLLEVYFEALQDLDEQDLIHARKELIGNHKFFPRVAEIRELALERRGRRLQAHREIAEHEAAEQARSQSAKRKVELAAVLAEISKAGPPADDAELLRRAILFAERDGRASLRAALTGAKCWRHAGALVIGHQPFIALYMNDVEALLEEAARVPVRLMLGHADPPAAAQEEA